MKSYSLALLTTVMSSLAAPFLSGNALAQDIDPVRHYEVEIILYKNTKVPKSKEYTLPISSPTKGGQTFDLSQLSSIEAAREQQYEVVPEVKLQLVSMAKKITRSSRYEVLKHFAWRQPGLEKSQVLPVWVKAGRLFGNEFISTDNKIKSLDTNQALGDDAVDFNSIDSVEMIDPTAAPLPEVNLSGLYEVEGKITVSLSRYLHVYADLVLRKPRNSLGIPLEATGSDPLPVESLNDAKILENYRLNEHRRMRSKTLHYLDSPEFSMLILITPYEIPIQLPNEASEEDLVKKVITSN